MSAPPLILASTSPFRKALLARLNLPFNTCQVAVDETPKPLEPAKDLVERLAIAKAQAARHHFTTGIAIGSDQVCVLEQQTVGKPKSHQQAVQQLHQASGKTVHFFTGLCLLDLQSQQQYSLVEPFDVTFKTLSTRQIDHYLKIEQPYQCAGSFKAEGLGIALFERLHGDDPTSLIGLPLIRLVKLLQYWDIDVLTQPEN